MRKFAPGHNPKVESKKGGRMGEKNLNFVGDWCVCARYFFPEVVSGVPPQGMKG